MGIKLLRECLIAFGHSFCDEDIFLCIQKLVVIGGESERTMTTYLDVPAYITQRNLLLGRWSLPLHTLAVAVRLSKTNRFPSLFLDLSTRRIVQSWLTWT